MRLAHLPLMAIVMLAASALSPAQAQTRHVLAGAPTSLSVTVYRDPYRREGGFNLNRLNGFAFITETRRVRLQPGQTHLRFEGVADGIESVSAIVTGLPSGVIEKNRDARLLSPSALVEAAQGDGGRVQLARTDPATGRTTRRDGVIRSGASGVVVETPDGIEALRCSGLAETFAFETSANGLSATPTLSVLARTDRAIEATVQLSYLARGFDWAADYVGGMSPDVKTFDLGGWITLANGNGVSFRNAQVQVVAGRLNRSTGAVEPIALGQPILAQCWPQGSTSDSADPIEIERAFPLGFDPQTMVLLNGRRAMADMAVPAPTMMAPGAPPPPPPPPPPPEALGDLKLYRIPDATLLASRQSKQVRLMETSAVPVTRLYDAEFYSGAGATWRPAIMLLRTKNDKQSNLGLPLPSGRVSLFDASGAGADAPRLLAAQTSLRDLAVDEEVELRLSASPDVQVQHTIQQRRVAGDPVDQVSRIEVTNARSVPVQVEIRLRLQGGARIVSAGRTVEQKNGQPIFRLTLQANSATDFTVDIDTP